MLRQFGIPAVLRSPDEGGGTPAPTPAPAPIPTPAPAAAPPIPWEKPDNAWKLGDKPWFEVTLPDGPTKELMRTKNYGNPQVLADSYYALNKMAAEGGEGRVVVPAADATQEQWDAYYAKRGRLESADKYEFKSDDPAKPLDPTMAKFGQQVAFNLGLTASEAQKLAPMWNEFASTVLTEQTNSTAAANETELTTLRQKWGGDETWKEMTTAGRRAADALGMDAAAVAKLDATMGTAATLDFLARIGKASAEGRFVNPGGGNQAPNTPGNMSKDQASAEIAKLENDSVFQSAYRDRNNPAHKEATERMLALFARTASA